MNAYDDGDFASSFAYSSMFSQTISMKLPEPTQVTFVAGSDDTRSAYVDIVKSIYNTLTANGMTEFNSLSVAGSGDQTFGWLRELYQLMAATTTTSKAKSVVSGQSTQSKSESQQSTHVLPVPVVANIHMVDTNPYQVDLCRLKYEGIKTLSYDDMILLHSRKAENTDRRKGIWQKLISKVNAISSLHNESYWSSSVQSVSMAGILALDLWIKVMPLMQQKMVVTYNQLCSSVSEPVSNYFELYSVIQKQPLTRLLCFTKSAPSMPYSGIQAGGWNSLRFPYFIMERCEGQLKKSNTWFCHILHKRNDLAVVPWLEKGLPWPNSGDPNVNVKMSYVDIVNALKASKDDSLHFVDFVNLFNFIPNTVIESIYSLLHQKLSPIGGLVLISICKLGSGACLETGGDYDACREYLILKANEYGLVVEESISADNIGHSMVVHSFLILKKKN